MHIVVWQVGCIRPCGNEIAGQARNDGEGWQRQYFFVRTMLVSRKVGHSSSLNGIAGQARNDDQGLGSTGRNSITTRSNASCNKSMRTLSNPLYNDVYCLLVNSSLRLHLMRLRLGGYNDVLSGSSK